MTTIHIGQAVNLEDEPVDWITWAIFKKNGKLMRAFVNFGQADLSSAAQVVKPFKARLMAIVTEPVYDHGGYFDPSGGIFTEEDYQKSLKKLASKILSKPLRRPFVTCPICQTTHTRSVTSCRECQHVIKLLPE